MSHAALTRPRPSPRVPDRDGPVRRTVRVIGELALTLGLVALLFLFYELYVTNWLSAMKQQEATEQLDRQWAGNSPYAAPVAAPLRVPAGEPFAKMFIPEFGSDWSYTVLEGTSQPNLEVGPGHYSGTAGPGRPGNFALAGHRVGTGSPFLDVGELESCDSMVIETARYWFVYRVLPMRGERAGWARGKGRLPRCAGVAPLPAPYGQVPGRRIVDPSAVQVLDPVPGRPGVGPPRSQRRKLITLTTCHPKFSAQQRMIIHGVLTGTYPKSGPPPAVLGG